MTSGGPEHLGFIVADLDDAMESFVSLGHRWSRIRTPTTRILRGGASSKTTVRYVVTTGGFPRLKLIEEVPGSYWVRDGTYAPHHLTYWVGRIEDETQRLVNMGARIDADGLDVDGALRYRYLILPGGVRVELSRAELRSEFEAWANEGHR